MTRQRLALPAVLLLALLTLAGCARVEDTVFAAGVAAERWRAGLAEAEVQVDDIRWHYLQNEWQPGRETVVLLHGYSADKENFTRFAGALGDGYNLLIPDLPGHGESTQEMALAYDIDTQARRVASLLDALGIARAHVAGNSMGGAISARLAWLAPGKVATLGLFNAGGVKVKDSEFDALLAQGENPLIVRRPEDMDTVIAFAMAKKPFLPWPAKSVMAREGMRRVALNEKILEDLKRDNSWDQTQAVQEVVARTLVLWGDQDRLLDVANADGFVSLMPNATKVVMTGIGHLPMLEDPEASARIYREFLAGG